MKHGMCAATIATLLSATLTLAIDFDHDGIDDAHEDVLLSRFAPIVRLHSQDTLRPANVDWLLPQARMAFNHDGCPDHELRAYGQVTPSNVTEQSHPENVAFCFHGGNVLHSDEDAPPTDLSSGFFLQFLESARTGTSQGGWTVYAHAYPGQAGRTVLQYWLFYPYNHAFGTFNHEGDWEYVAVVLDANEQAESYILAAHGDPHAFHVSENRVETEGDHPIVYSARGSHASYPSYTGDVCDGSPNIGLIPMDRCDASGPEWRTWEIGFGGIVNVGERGYPAPTANWLDYSGLWGEVGAWPEIPAFRHTSGPRGPAWQRASWHIAGSKELCANGIDDDVDGTTDEFPCTDVKPDLAMTESNPAIAPNGHGGWITIEPGESFPVRCGLDNLGTGFTELFDVEFVLSLDRERSPDDILLDGCLFLEGMPAATSYASIPTWDVTAPTWTPPGEYWVIATADAGNVVDEGLDGEDNNRRVSQMKVTVRGSGGQNATAASGGAVTVADNFSDFAAQAFDPERGSWSAGTGSYLGVAPSSVDRDDGVSLVDSATLGATIDVDFAIHVEGPVGPYLGVALRWADASNYLRVDVRRVGSSTRLRLLEEIGGVRLELGSATLPRGVEAGLHHLRVDDDGCRVTVALNRETVLDVPYTSAVERGARGLFVNRGNTAMFDNFLLVEHPGADADADGWTTCAGDCDDGSPAVHPGRAESCATPVDDDCDGLVNEGCGGSCRKDCPHVEQSP